MATITVQTQAGTQETKAWYVEQGLAVHKALYVKGYHVIHMASGLALDARAFSTRAIARTYQQALLQLPVDWKMSSTDLLATEERRNLLMDVHNQYR